MPPPPKAELDQLLKTLTSRIGRHLERHGWLTRDAESSHLNLDREDTALDSLLGHSITYRIALGPRTGQKAFTLQSLPGTLLPEHPPSPFSPVPTVSPCTLAYRPVPMTERKSSDCAATSPGRPLPRTG